MAAGVVGAFTRATSAELHNKGFQHNQLIDSMITSKWVTGDMAQQREFSRMVERAVYKAEMNSSNFRLKYIQKGMIWSEAAGEFPI